MSLYNLLLYIHVAAAIFGMGPSFVMTGVIAKVETMTELRHGFRVRKRIHLFIAVGGTLLIITGLMMGFMRPALFGQFWYTMSLILYGIIFIVGLFVLVPVTRPIKQLIANHQGEQIPKTYDQMAKKLFFVERLTNVLIATIIILMILKPF